LTIRVNNLIHFHKPPSTGQYKYMVMPFRLNSPSVFQTFINDVFMLNHWDIQI